jgi:hypothetical protein
VKPTLAQIVIEAGLATASQVAGAEAEARRRGEPLIVALVTRAGVGDDALAVALGRRLGLPETPALDIVESEALREVPHELARRRHVLPLSIDLGADGVRVMRVAMADPTDADTVTSLEGACGCRLERFVAPLGILGRAIERAYQSMVTLVMPRASAGPGTIPTPLGPAGPGGEGEPRRLLGGDLAVKTPMHGDPPPGPVTQPFHRLEDEVPLELRLRALVELLQQKGLLTADEWQEKLRVLLREHE